MLSLNIFAQVLGVFESFAGRLHRAAADREAGQGALEYVGMILVVGAIIGAFVASGLGDMIVDKAESLIDGAF